MRVYVVGFIYIVLRLKPTAKKTVESEEKPNCFSMFCFRDFVATVNVAFMKRHGTHPLQIFLILLAYIFVVGPVLGRYFIFIFNNALKYLQHNLITGDLSLARPSAINYTQPSKINNYQPVEIHCWT